MIFLTLIKRNINIIEYNPLLFIPVFTLVVYLLSLVSSFIIKKIPGVNKLI